MTITLPRFLDEGAALTDPTGLPEGMLEHSIAQDIHALRCMVGFEEMRMRVAEILNYESGWRPRNGQEN